MSKVAGEGSAQEVCFNLQHTRGRLVRYREETEVITDKYPRLNLQV